MRIRATFLGTDVLVERRHVAGPTMSASGQFEGINLDAHVPRMLARRARAESGVLLGLSSSLQRPGCRNVRRTRAVCFRIPATMASGRAAGAQNCRATSQRAALHSLVRA